MFSVISFTLVLSFFLKSSPIGFKDSSFTFLPLGLPICDIIIILVFCCIKKFKVGSILSILVVSLIFPFSRGTFKSNLSNIFLLLRFFSFNILLIKRFYSNSQLYRTFYWKNPTHYHTKPRFYPF